MLEMFRNLARSVFGMNHVANQKNQYLEIVGNGLDAEHPRNARTLDIAGNEVLAGRLTVGAQPVDDNDVATKKYVDDNASSVLPAVTAEDNGNVLTVVEGAWAKAAPSGGGGWAVTTLIDDSSVELDNDPGEIGSFRCAYPNVQLGFNDFIMVTVNGDIQGSGRFMVDESGSTTPNKISIPITGGKINVYFGALETGAYFGVNYIMANPPTEAPSVSLKVERIGDSSGEQPWAEDGEGGIK